MTRSKEARTPGLDRLLLTLVVVLAAWGLLTLYSVTQPMKEGPAYFLKKQGLNVAVGFFFMMLITRLNLKMLDNTMRIALMMGGTLVLLVLVMVPPFATKINGAYRWLRLGPLNIQPSELAKAVLLLFMAHYLSARKEHIRSFWSGVLPAMLIMGVYIGLVAAEPDLGGAAVICGLLLVMLFIGGAQLRSLAVLGAGGLVFVALAIVMSPWRVKRFLGFLDPTFDQMGVNWQPWQAQLAIGSGGWKGVGFGNGWQKAHYVPEIHTDFILANLGEELGLLGLLAVLGLFFFLVWRSIRLTMRADDPFLRHCGVGAASLLGLQIAVNSGVVMSILPNKGLAMPFFSFGGSNTVLNFILMGIILAVAKAWREDTGKQRVVNLLAMRHQHAEAGE